MSYKWTHPVCSFRVVLSHSLGLLFWRLILVWYAYVSVTGSFLPLEWYSFAWMWHNLFIHDKHQLVPSGVVMGKAAMNVLM